MRFTLGFFVALAAAQTAQDVVSALQGIDSATKSLGSVLAAGITSSNEGQLASAATGLDAMITKANSVAKAVPKPVSSQDQYSVLSEVETLYPDVISTLQNYVKQSANIQKLLSGAGLTILKQIASDTAALASTLEGDATGSYSSIASTLANAINSAFTSAIANNSPQAINLPTIPQPSGGSGSGTTSSSPSTTTGSSGGSGSSSASVPVYSTGASSPTTPAGTYTTGSGSGATAPGVPQYTGAAGRTYAQIGAAMLAAGVAVVV